MTPDTPRADEFGPPPTGLKRALDSMAGRDIQVDAAWETHLDKVKEARRSSRVINGSDRFRRRSLIPPVIWTAAVAAAIAIALIGFRVGNNLLGPSNRVETPSHHGSPATHTTKPAVHDHSVPSPHSSAVWDLVPAYGQAGFSGPAIWDGTEFVVDIGNGNEAYDPTSETWRTLPAPPNNRTNPFAVWTGNQLLVFGGSGGNTYPASNPEVDGAAFTPRTDAWTPIASMPTAFDTKDLVGGAVWTGTEAVVWAKNGKSELVAAYNPATNSWRTLPASGMPVGNGADVSVFWTGTQVLVWKATPAGYPVPNFAYGGLLNPVTGQWTAVSAPPEVLGGYGDAVTWTSDGLFVWSGQASSNDSQLDDAGAMYDPTTNTWATLPSSPLTERVGATAVWTGQQVLVFGGRVSGTTLQLASDNASYDPSTRAWALLPTAPPSSQIRGDVLPEATARWFALGAWDGSEAVVLGGIADSHSQGRFDGFTFKPAS
jgi:N-acetylneuraminic acid mutarotase